MYFTLLGTRPRSLLWSLNKNVFFKLLQNRRADEEPVFLNQISTSLKPVRSALGSVLMRPGLRCSTPHSQTADSGSAGVRCGDGSFKNDKCWIDKGALPGARIAWQQGRGWGFGGGWLTPISESASVINPLGECTYPGQWGWPGRLWQQGTHRESGCRWLGRPPPSGCQRSRWCRQKGPERHSLWSAATHGGARNKNQTACYEQQSKPGPKLSTGLTCDYFRAVND